MRGRQTADVCRDIGNILGAAQVMLVGEMLHAQVPALIVSIVDELVREDAKMLRGNRRYRAIACSRAVSPVTGWTGLKQLLAAYQICLAAQNRVVLLLRA